MLRKVFIILGCLWSLPRIAIYIFDMTRPDVDLNYFGVFFATVILLATLLLGNGLLFVVYIVLKSLCKIWGWVVSIRSRSSKANEKQPQEKNENE